MQSRNLLNFLTYLSVDRQPQCLHTDSGLVFFSNNGNVCLGSGWCRDVWLFVFYFPRQVKAVWRSDVLSKASYQTPAEKLDKPKNKRPGSALTLHAIRIQLVCVRQNSCVNRKIIQYLSIKHISLWALQLLLDAFVDHVKDRMTGTIIFDSVRCVEQLLFSVSLYLQRAIWKKAFEKCMWPIFLQLLGLNVLPTHMKSVQASNSEN